MSELRGGAGGYGGCTSMNSEQRTSPYHPHKGPIVKYISNKTTPATMHVECISCRKKWTHLKGDPWGSGPEVCE